MTSVCVLIMAAEPWVSVTSTDSGSPTMHIHYTLLLSLQHRSHYSSLLVAVSSSFCRSTRETVPSGSFLRKFQASMRAIRVTSTALTLTSSSPTLSTPPLSAAPPEKKKYYTVIHFHLMGQFRILTVLVLPLTILSNKPAKSILYCT